LAARSRSMAVGRLLAAKLGHQAVLALAAGESDVCVSLKDDRTVFVPLATAIRPKTMETVSDYELLKVLS
jgi:6-phosphofructokinase